MMDMWNWENISHQERLTENLFRAREKKHHQKKLPNPFIPVAQPLKYDFSFTIIGLTHNQND